jgi:hypothetical protein
VLPISTTMELFDRDFPGHCSYTPTAS